LAPRQSNVKLIELEYWYDPTVPTLGSSSPRRKPCWLSCAGSGRVVNRPDSPLTRKFARLVRDFAGDQGRTDADLNSVTGLGSAVSRRLAGGRLFNFNQGEALAELFGFDFGAMLVCASSMADSAVPSQQPLPRRTKAAPASNCGGRWSVSPKPSHPRGQPAGPVDSRRAA
jgi:hypothetical protein